MFFVIELATRRIDIAGITSSPNEAWMMQIGRNLTDSIDGSLAEKRFLILDRDTKFTVAFRNLLDESDVEVVRLPYRSPNLNAYAERFVDLPPLDRSSPRGRIPCLGMDHEGDRNGTKEIHG